MLIRRLAALAWEYEIPQSIVGILSLLVIWGGVVVGLPVLFGH